MANARPTTLWAFASFSCGLLGCIICLIWLVMAERYAELARGSAGVGAIWMGLHMMLAAAFCLLAVLLSLVALARISTKGYVGRGWAWAGVALGCMPLLLWLIAFLASEADSNPLR